MVPDEPKSMILSSCWQSDLQGAFRVRSIQDLCYILGRATALLDFEIWPHFPNKKMPNVSRRLQNGVLTYNNQCLRLDK